MLSGQAIFNNSHNAKMESIELVSGFPTGGFPTGGVWINIPDSSMLDFAINVHRRLVVMALGELINNAYYWMGQLHRRNGKARLYIGPSVVNTGRAQWPAIVVGDNGPGFQHDGFNWPNEVLVKPFISGKAGSPGMGLYMVERVMEEHGGFLVFPEQGEVCVPDYIDGAVVALAFPSHRRATSDGPGL